MSFPRPTVILEEEDEVVQVAPAVAPAVRRGGALVEEDDNEYYEDLAESEHDKTILRFLAKAGVADIYDANLDLRSKKRSSVIHRKRKAGDDHDARAVLAAVKKRLRVCNERVVARATGVTVIDESLEEKAAHNMALLFEGRKSIPVYSLVKTETELKAEKERKIYLTEEMNARRDYDIQRIKAKNTGAKMELSFGEFWSKRRATLGITEPKSTVDESKAGRRALIRERNLAFRKKAYNEECLRLESKAVGSFEGWSEEWHKKRVKNSPLGQLRTLCKAALEALGGKYKVGSKEHSEKERLLRSIMGKAREVMINRAVGRNKHPGRR